MMCVLRPRQVGAGYVMQQARARTLHHGAPRPPSPPRRPPRPLLAAPSHCVCSTACTPVTRGGAGAVAAAAVYNASLLLLYTASALYHGAWMSPRIHRSLPPHTQVTSPHAQVTSPACTGHFPACTGHFPACTGHFPACKGHVPRIHRSRPPHTQVASPFCSVTSPRLGCERPPRMAGRG